MEDTPRGGASEVKELTEKVRQVIELYKVQYPEVRMDRDYAALKISEEWGEALQSYLMLTDRGRQKGKTKEAIRAEMSNELADVFGYLLAFAAQEGVDLPDALAKKWFAYLKR